MGREYKAGDSAYLKEPFRGYRYVEVVDMTACGLSSGLQAVTNLLYGKMNWKARIDNMDDKKPCNCPFCNGAFTPAEGMTGEEHIANGIIEVYAEMQENDALPCPRCGVARMLPGVERNALSRHHDVYICSECGNEEAIRIYQNNVLPTALWWCVKEML